MNISTCPLLIPSVSVMTEGLCLGDLLGSVEVPVGHEVDGFLFYSRCSRNLLTAREGWPPDFVANTRLR